MKKTHTYRKANNAPIKKTPFFGTPHQSAAANATTQRNYNVSILLDTSLYPLKIIIKLSDIDELNSTHIVIHNLEPDLLIRIISNPREFDVANRVKVDAELSE